MPNGKFIVEVKAPRKRKFEELTIFEWDSGAKLPRGRRYAALEKANSCVVGWHSRYAQFRDAQFQVKELVIGTRQRQGKVIDLHRELEKERGSRAAFAAAVAKQRWDAADTAEGLPMPKGSTKAAVAASRAVGSQPAARQGRASPPVGRRTVRRAAKKRCKEAEGTTDNWRNYL